jgi:hypothetical protein
MRKLFFLATLLASSMSFAESIPVTNKPELIRAIQDALNVNDLVCTQTVGGSHVLPASMWSWSYYVDFNMKINESEQPAITISDVKDTYEQYFYLKTDRTFTEITSIIFEQSTLKKVSKNVGTIIRPKYENVVEKKLIQKWICR